MSRDAGAGAGGDVMSRWMPTTGGSSWKICLDSGRQDDESELAEASDVALDFRCSRCGSECSEDLDEEEGRIA